MSQISLFYSGRTQSGRYGVVTNEWVGLICSENGRKADEIERVWRGIPKLTDIGGIGHDFPDSCCEVSG